jgi:hypothetical protein
VTPASDPFLAWGRGVIDASASRLEAQIAGAHRGRESHLSACEAIYLHLRDAHVQQDVAVWLFAAKAGTANNVRGYGDVIGVGLKHDADEELTRGAWKLRPLAPFSWRTHVDDRHEGFRWLRNAAELPEDATAAGEQIAERVLTTLRRARAVPPPA